MTDLVDALGLAVAVARRAAPEGVRVESAFTLDAAATLPLIVVSTSAPVSVPNGPIDASATFDVVVACYSESRAQAAQVCRQAFRGFVQHWRDGIHTEHGWISRLTNSSRQPVQVQSDLEADDVYRFDCVLSLIARA